VLCKASFKNVRLNVGHYAARLELSTPPFFLMNFKYVKGYINDCAPYLHHYLISYMKSVRIMVTENIPYKLAQTVKEHSNRVALSFLRNGAVETELTFRQLQDDIIELASGFKDLGVNQGDRVVIFIPKSVFAVIAHFAIQTIGAISVPLNPGFTRNEMSYLLHDSRPQLIIIEPEKKSFIEDIYANGTVYEIATNSKYQGFNSTTSVSAEEPATLIKPEYPALIIYTSGTTGNPKGAVLSHRNLLHDAGNINEVWEITSEDTVCHTLPLFHVHGLCFAFQTPLLAGARINMLDTFKPEDVTAELSRNSGDNICSVFMAVPAMYTKLFDFLESPRLDFSHLRLITSGSAPLLVKEFNRITQIFGQQPVEREGMSETGMNFSNPIKGRRIPGSIGLPLPGLQVKIVDPESYQDIPSGEVGELWLRSKSIMAEYWRKPQETEDTYHDDWFRTGDLARVDQDGYYYLTDRIKHIIISGGENVSAKEVETVIDKLQGVDESVVVGKPDEKWGEVVVAAIKTKPDVQLTDAEVKTFCKQHLHTWKCPKKVLFVSEIPRNTMGKVLKEEVKKCF
jgi:malonyl-CoA/methylmalonyl-CoA synthetase